MKTRVTKRKPVQYKTCLGEPIGPNDPGNVRERAYLFYVELSDEDFEHTHNEGGHAFPATLEDLLSLRRQLNAVINANR